MMLYVNSKKLEEIRKKKNLSQHRLSILSGLSSNAIHRMEKKEYKVSFLRAQEVAKTLNCPLEEIFHTTLNDEEKTAN